MKSIAKYIFLLLLLLRFNEQTFGQNRIIDSLKSALKNAKHDTIRCAILNEMIGEEENDSIWPVYNDQLLKIVNQHLENKNSNDNRKFYIKHFAEAQYHLAYSAHAKNDLSEALKYYEKCLSYEKQLESNEVIANTLNNMGQLYVSLGNIPKALDYYQKSLKIVELDQNKNRAATVLNSIGFALKTQGDFPQALEYYHRSYKLHEQGKDKNGMAYALNNIGAIYYAQNNNVKALEYYTKSLKFREEVKNKKGIAQSLNNIGNIYEHQGDLVKGLEYHARSLAITQEIHDLPGMALSLNNIALLKLSKNEAVSAYGYAFRSLKIANEIGYPESIRNSAQVMKEVCQKLGKYKEAFEMYELQIKMRDSISNQETQKVAVKKQMQYDYEKKEAVTSAEHKSELEKQQAVADEKTRRQQIVIWSVGIGLLLVIAFAIFILRSLNLTREQKHLIEIKNKETEEQKHIIEEKQREIIDSIMYARRIQRALITPEKYIEKSLNRLGKE